MNSGIIVNYENNKLYIRTYDNFKINDVLNISSSSILKNDMSNDFYKYLKSQKVDYIIQNAQIRYTSSIYSIKENIVNYMSKGGPYYSRYNSLILFGHRNYINEIVYFKFTNLSIVHLITISGFHINITIYILNKLLLLLKIKNKYIYSIPIFIIIPYLVLLEFPLAATRAFIFIFLRYINNNFLNKKFHVLNLLGFVMICFLILNPFIVFSMSFVFSFALTYVITFLSNSSIKYKKTRIFIYTWLISIFINIYMNDEINFTSIISNIFLTPIISFTYILSLLFFWLKPVMDNYYLILDIVINFFVIIKISVQAFVSSEWLIFFSIIIFAILLLKINKPIMAKNFSKKFSKKNINWWLNQW